MKPYHVILVVLVTAIVSIGSYATGLTLVKKEQPEQVSKTKYYTVSYAFQDSKNKVGVGSLTAQMDKLIVPNEVRDRIISDNKYKKAVILNYIELTKEQYDTNTNLDNSKDQVSPIQF